MDVSLSHQERQRLRELLRKAQQGQALTPTEKQELRSLLSKEDPRAQEMNWRDVVKFGLLVLGIAAAAKILDDALQRRQLKP